MTAGNEFYIYVIWILLRRQFSFPFLSELQDPRTFCASVGQRSSRVQIHTHTHIIPIRARWISSRGVSVYAARGCSCLVSLAEWLLLPVYRVIWKRSWHESLASPARTFRCFIGFYTDLVREMHRPRSLYCTRFFYDNLIMKNAPTSVNFQANLIFSRLNLQVVDENECSITRWKLETIYMEIWF